MGIIAADKHYIFQRHLPTIYFTEKRRGTWDIKYMKTGLNYLLSFMETIKTLYVSLFIICNNNNLDKTIQQIFILTAALL